MGWPGRSHGSCIRCGPASPAARGPRWASGRRAVGDLPRPACRVLVGGHSQREVGAVAALDGAPARSRRGRRRHIRHGSTASGRTERERPGPQRRGSHRRGGVLPPVPVRPPRAGRPGRGDRRFGLPVRAGARAGVRPRRAVARPRCGARALLAAVGLGTMGGPGRDPRRGVPAGGAPMTRVPALLAALSTFALVASACSGGGPEPIRGGAVYPLAGSQGPGGVDEYRGVRLAADLVNGAGGVDGRPIQLVALNVPSSDAAAAGVDQLAGQGIRLVLGSYGSTISEPAALEATHHGMLFWETGAVGSMPGAGPGRLFFRVAPSGSVLGRAAIAFIADRLAPVLHRSARSLRFAVADVDDLYGRSVADGAVAEIRDLGLTFAGRFPYDPYRPNLPAVVRRIARARPDALFVSAYLQDGIAIRRQMVRQHLHLLAGIGSSSSFCMQAFGDALGPD